MKSVEQLKADALKRVGETRPVTRQPRPGSEAYFLERDKEGRSYSVFCFKVLPNGGCTVTLVLEGALYQGARECVLKHTIEENARAVERQYGDAA